MNRFSKVLLLCLWMTACASAVGDVEFDVVDVETAEVCTENRDDLLALDYEAFDQDFKGGWRAVSFKNNNGCQLEAAELIAEYKSQPISLKPWQLRILHWHEGQLYAFHGISDKAVDLFRESYDPNSKNTAWNLYVDASIAFLKKDRDSFDESYKELVALPYPNNWEERVKNTKEKWGYTPQWPQNLNVFDAFDRCFEKTYAEAYGKCNRGIGSSVDSDSTETKASESP